MADALSLKSRQMWFVWVCLVHISFVFSLIYFLVAFNRNVVLCELPVLSEL